MQKDIKVIVLKPGERAEEVVIENSLKSLQRIVGGHIEVIRIDKKLLLIVNEEGKLKKLPINFFMKDDYICGPAIFAGEAGEAICDVPYDVNGCMTAVMNH